MNKLNKKNLKPHVLADHALTEGTAKNRTAQTTTHDDELIVAQCTPTGSGALALIRLSGVGAIESADHYIRLASGAAISTVDTHTIHYGSVIENSSTIDTVMITVMRAPRTFTGHDTVEITCHNNPFIVEQIIQCAVQHGARIAENGEFTQRAFLNKKIDLIQAESINELIHANSRHALKRSLAQVDGSLSQWVEGIERQLLKCIALSEASFEFIDEDMSFGDQIADIIAELTQAVSNAQRTFDVQQQVREGIRIALIGSVNAGKSSLFNALLNKDRAIVTSIAGTTRDALEAGVYRDNYYITFVDTAGLRQTDDLIEQEGISRSHAEAAKADIILFIVDGSRTQSAQEIAVYRELLDQYSAKIIPVVSKSDLPTIQLELTLNNPHSLTSTNQTSVRELESVIQTKIDDLFAQCDSPFMLNKRQHSLLVSLDQQLASISQMLTSHIDYELLSVHLKDALTALSELTGRTISEAGMDAVFKEFCVGK